MRRKIKEQNPQKLWKCTVCGTVNDATESDLDPCGQYVGAPSWKPEYCRHCGEEK